MNKTEIINVTKKIFNCFSKTCNTITERDSFTTLTENKLPVAENVQHLIISTNKSTLASTLPRFVVRWVNFVILPFFTQNII